jgi:uncharacterized membrane protein
MAVMDKARAEAFSDGVLAVAITLLALDLHVEATGHGSLSHQLAQTWPSFVAYLVSFFVIGVIWVNHHGLFALIDRVDRILLFENLTLLMFVTTLPFTTSTLAKFVRDGGANARGAVLLYGISNIGMAFGFTAMLSRIVHHGLLANPVAPEVAQRAVRRFGLGTIAYPLATAAGLLWPPLILIAIAVLAVYYVVEQTHILTNADRAQVGPEGS